jgi:hypothetical protein
MENTMQTLTERALHYVECYALHFPNSGAGDVADELRSAAIPDATCNEVVTALRNILETAREAPRDEERGRHTWYEVLCEAQDVLAKLDN